MSAALTTNVDQRLLRTTKFPPEFNVKVDMQKVNNQLIKTWVVDEIARILKNDDDIVTELVSNILDDSRYPNIKELQIQLTGFLDKDAATFCETLWKLCLSAQASPHGVPKELLEAKKAELAQAKAEEDKQREDVMKRQEAERERERELARIRERERDGRSDRGRGRGRGGRYGRDSDRRPPPRDSRSPPPRRWRDDDDYRRPPPPRAADTYVPGKDRANDRPPRRRRSPSLSRSPTPPPRRRRRNTSSEASRSPPRRRRRHSSSQERSQSRSRSRDRRDDRGNGRHDNRRRRSPSPPRRGRSPSPKHSRRKSPAGRSRSPPTKRSRKASPSPARSQSSHSDAPAPAKADSPRKKNGTLAPTDLIASANRTQDTNRLSREPSDSSGSRGQTPMDAEMVGVKS